jgi:hypothetical protein
MQTPFVQVPVHGWLHPPQFCALVVTSTHAAGEPQSIWPCVQAQTPPLQVAPAGQGVHPPQCSAVPPDGATQAPSVHCVSPAWHDPHTPFEQPWSAPQTMSHVPQWAAFDATHCPPQASNPPVQTHCPLLHICPSAQALPHAPQFCTSEATFEHVPAHIICPALHVPPTPPVPPFPTEPRQASAPSASPTATMVTQ